MKKLLLYLFCLSLTLVTNGQLINVQVNSPGGTTNYLPKWTSAYVLSLGASTIYDNGSSIGIGTTSPTAKLHLLKSGTGFQDLGIFENSNDPTGGASRVWIKNTVASLIVQSYGTVAGSVLSQAASIVAASGSKLLIGASTNMPIQMYTNNSYATPQVTLDINGKFGVGTSTPYSKLHIVGNSVFTATGSAITSSAYIRGNNNYSTATTPDYTWYNNDQVGIFHPSANNIAISTSGIEAFRIASDGNIGFGTTTPTQKLEISHNSSSGGIALTQTLTSSSKSEIKFKKNGNQLWAIGNDFNNDNHQTFFIWDHISGTAPLYINENGQVGIGTIIPSTASVAYRLYVDAGIVARDVLVTAGTFPDYVFYKDYNLMSICELEKFIKLKGHLPNFPSENEIIKSNGYELGTMNQNIVKTIEEQALYIIDLQKQIDKLKLQITDLLNK